MLRLLLCAAVCSLSLNTTQAARFNFGLWGDMPYAKANDKPKMPALLKSINTADIAFSIYDGDIKDGSSKCTDDVFDEALSMFNNMAKPLIYIPGDNEWTDCHRLNNGGYDTLERLAFLRTRMYPSLNSLGRKTMPLLHQGKLGEKFVENTRFAHQGIVFVGLNIPGSNNNRILDEKDCSNKSARTPAQCEANNAEYKERDEANINWLHESFEHARQQKSAGVVVVFQADPGFDLPETEDRDESLEPRFNGYRNFMERLVAETERFQGQVLVVHGDTHFYKVDKPLYSPTKLLPNFTRLQTFGSPSLHWVKVSVDTKTPEVFTVRPVIVEHK